MTINYYRYACETLEIIEHLREVIAIMLCVSMSETDINDNDKPQRRQSEWYHMSVMESKITGNSTAFVASLCRLKTKKPSNVHTTGLCGWIPLTKEIHHATIVNGESEFLESVVSITGTLCG